MRSIIREVFMIRRLCCMVALAAPLHAQSPGTPDTAGTGALIAEAMNHSDVMANLGYLADVIGPRLSTSSAIRRANEWTAERFKAYGLGATLESYPFGVAWSRGPATARLLAPFTRAVTAHSWGWTVGTGGRAVAGAVVRVDLSSPDSVAAYRDRIRGAWVLGDLPATIWNPDGAVPTAQDSAQLREQQRRRALLTADTSAAAVKARRQFSIDLPYLLKAAGARGVLLDGGKEHALKRMSGSPRSVRPLPTLVMAHEDYAMLDRLLTRGVTPRFEARVDNQLGRRGGRRSGRAGNRQRYRRHYGAGTAGPQRSRVALAAAPGAGRITRRGPSAGRDQEWHRPSLVRALRDSGVQLRSDAARVQPHAPLGERYVR
jgi:carboxypeptidase Q